MGRRIQRVHGTTQSAHYYDKQTCHMTPLHANSSAVQSLECSRRAATKLPALQARSCCLWKRHLVRQRLLTNRPCLNRWSRPTRRSGSLRCAFFYLPLKLFSFTLCRQGFRPDCIWYVCLSGLDGQQRQAVALASCNTIEACLTNAVSVT